MAAITYIMCSMKGFSNEQKGSLLRGNPHLVLILARDCHFKTHFKNCDPDLCIDVVFLTSCLSLQLEDGCSHLLMQTPKCGRQERKILRTWVRVLTVMFYHKTF